MSEVKVTKETFPEKREVAAPGGFLPAFPFGRHFGRSPFGLIRDLSGEMDNLLRGAFHGARLEPWAPAVDIQHCNGDLVVTAELPGLKKEEVEVEINEEALIIQGERKLEHKEDHEGFHRFERSYGKFYRSIPLPEGAKADQAKAEMADGVLKIAVPVAEAKKTARQIPVEQATAAQTPAAPGPVPQNTEAAPKAA